MRPERCSLQGLCDLANVRAGARVQGNTFVRQAQRTRAALDQPHPEALLEVSNAARQRRLRLAACAAGPAETAVGGDQVEIGKGMKVHDCSGIETNCPNVRVYAP